VADDLWLGNPPRSVSTTLQTFVYQLRRRYGIEALRTTPAGYVLDVDDDAIDARRFETQMHAALGRAASDPGGAMRSLRAALDCWAGDAYHEFVDAPWAAAEAARLDQLRVDAVEAWAACAIGAHERAGLASELEAWTTRHPLRESLWALRLIALAADRRTAEALRVATGLRAVLRDELGVDPSASFNAIEDAILRDEELPPWPALGGFGLSGAVPPAAAPVSIPTPTAPRPDESRRRTRRSAPLTRPVPASQPPVRDLFVGRVAELTALEAALEQASSGVPQVVVISGAAGLGKSRLLDEFTPHAISRGVQALSGTCHEDGAVPYLPLASALAVLDPGATLFASASLPGDAGVDDDGARLALYLATTRAILDYASTRTTMLVVEDLHWVDDATLSLLRHLLTVVGEEGARRRTRLFIVLTTRPPGSGSGVANLFARLRRERLTTEIALRALTVDECRLLISEWLGARPARATISRLLEATAGNPLVLRSALGRVRGLGSPITESSLADLIGSTDLDHELWARVENLGTACSEMVVTAAFLGDGTALAVLATVCGIDAGALDELIDEAAKHEVLVADDECYWFAHPQLRQLVYHWPGGAERATKHLQIADLLAPLDSDIRVVAHHLVRAGSIVEPARLVSVTADAADGSAAVGAWRDAATYAATALEAAATLDLPAEVRAEMHLRAGHTALLARDEPTAMKQLEAAVELARACGAVDIWGRALVHLSREQIWTTELRTAAARSLARLDEFLANGSGDAALRGEAHALEAELYFAVGDLAAARRHSREAEELALEADDDELRVKVAFARGLQHLGSVELAEAAEQFETAAPLALTLRDTSPHIWCRSRLGLVAYATGALDRADALLGAAADDALRAENARELSMAAAFQASVATVRGRFAAAETSTERALSAHREAPTPFTPNVAFPALAAARAQRGDGRGAHEALDAWDELSGGRSRRFRPLVDAIVGDLDAVQRALEHPSFRLFTAAPRPSLFLTGAIAGQVELGARALRPDVVEDSLGALIDLYELGMRFAVGWPSFVPRVVALGLATIERREAASTWFERALADARRAGASAEVARTAADHARFLDERPDPAAPGADALREVARAAQARITDAPTPASDARDERGPRPTTRVLLVTDLEGSTALNDRLGDRDYVELLRAHDEIIRRRLSEFDGVEFKHTGDGIGAWFFSVNAALRCGAALAGDFASVASGPLPVKIALAAGEPTMVDRDLIGVAVTIAFRILELAQPGEVLVTSDVAGIARGLAWSFEARGRYELKGLDAPIEVQRATPVH
jgi:class 3 adenylate cyclase/DNA-binding SARP family transcriptional activator